MNPHVLAISADLLRRHYGPPVAPGRPGEWTTLVRVVLEQGRPAKKVRDWSWLEDSPLRTADETIGLGISRLAEVLAVNLQPEGRARPLHGCAQWWQGNFSADDGPADFTQRPLEAWQTDLRAISGVTWEMADRILLAVGGLTVYPLDRGSLRIAARHGWVDAGSDYDEWQAFFTRGLEEAHASLSELAGWNAEVAHDYCRSEPQCNECPLKSLLPDRGPVPLESE